jgi:hypothetical protein
LRFLLFLVGVCSRVSMTSVPHILPQLPFALALRLADATVAARLGGRACHRRRRRPHPVLSES